MMNENMDVFVTKTIDTIYEYDKNGNIIHRVTTETADFPEEFSVETETTFDFPDDDFDGIILEDETDVPTTFDLVKAAICGATLFAAGCAIVKAFRD